MNTTTINTTSRTEELAAEFGSTVSSIATFDRRHDLDALRAIAMLLGIVLHTALSFAPIPWPVQDEQQSEFYPVLFAFIHGFRMPLFFMLSGFFTAMLWRKRGLRFGSIGMFRRFLSRESKTLRYISDSSYWLYLVHLPLVILAQWLVRDLPLPAFIKFTGIIVVVSAILLVTYEYGVRYTMIGRLLNGPRNRPARAT